MGQILGAWGTGLDVFSTTISSAGLAVQIGATAAFGPTGPDDLLAHGGYPLVLDPLENAVSIAAAGAIRAGDFLAGTSSISAGGSQVIIGQDTIVVGTTAMIGQMVGRLPLAGPAADTAINLAVNFYDFGRLASDVPTFVELHISEYRQVYVVLYP